MLPLQLRTLSNVDGLQYNVSVPYPKLGLAEITGNIELGAAPLVQYYSVFSARPSLEYGTLIHFTLHTAHCTPHTAHCTPHTAHCTLHTADLGCRWAGQSQQEKTSELQGQEAGAGGHPGDLQQCSSAVQYSSTVQYSTVQYSTVQYSIVQYSTVQYSTVVQYSTIVRQKYFMGPIQFLFRFYFKDSGKT